MPTTQAPDTGTGEHTHAVDPITSVADDVTNEGTAEVSHAESPTFHADDVTGGPVDDAVGGSTESDPVATIADWPPHGEDKSVKADKAAAKAAPAKKASTKKKGA